MSSKVRTRFAPSPTGYLHVGGLRTALFSYLFAKHNGGDFILRVEDTDQARFVQGAIEKLIHILKEMGLDYNEGLIVKDNELTDSGSHGPYLQSRRKDIYKKHADILIEQKKAYMCFCDEKRLEELRKEQEALKQPTRYDRKCRNLSQEEIKTNLDKGMPYVVRQAVPLEGQTILKDLVYKDIVWDNKTLDDQILLKSDGFPTYHLAVVVDDHLMEISHVVRGEEWLPSVAKHILLYQAFGWDVPHFAHLPLLLNKDRSKLSKRQGDVSVEDYLAKGYLKEALINFVALLGWNPKTDQEIFSMNELIDQFDLAKVNKSGAIFDNEKLDWLNSQYIKKMDSNELLNTGIAYLQKAGLLQEKDGQYVAKNGKSVSVDFLLQIMALEKDRIKKLSEIGDSIGFFFMQPTYDPQILIWRKSNLENTKHNLQKLLNFMSSMDDSDFKNELSVENKIKQFIQENNLDNGSVLWPLRVALSGLEASPGPFQITAILFIGFGKYEILQRIETALKLLQ
ncbi:glutamate--tRNA ligase [Patescibacteria group bacterium]|nr:glutamate--tRNA ligase [Patescibacteria group bacterium]